MTNKKLSRTMAQLTGSLYLHRWGGIRYAHGVLSATCFPFSLCLNKRRRTMMIISRRRGRTPNSCSVRSGAPPAFALLACDAFGVWWYDRTCHTVYLERMRVFVVVWVRVLCMLVLRKPMNVVESSPSASRVEISVFESRGDLGKRQPCDC